MEQVKFERWAFSSLHLPSAGASFAKFVLSDAFHREKFDSSADASAALMEIKCAVDHHLTTRERLTGAVALSHVIPARKPW